MQKKIKAKIASKSKISPESSLRQISSKFAASLSRLLYVLQDHFLCIYMCVCGCVTVYSQR